MVSPMREKRAWPPKEKDADSAESAAFEATVAVVKETVVRSGEVLVSAKEDLSDHKRWLEAQRAAVQADRARHERWLQRQQEKQEALDRREAAKRRRQLARQRTRDAVEDAIFAVVDAILSFFWLCVAKVVAFFAYLRRSIVNAFVWVGARLRDFGSYIAHLVRSGASAVAGKTRALAGATGSALSAAGSSVAAKSGELARSTGSAFSAAGSSLVARSGELARSTGSKLVLARASVAVKSSERVQVYDEDVAPASSPTLAETTHDETAVVQEPGEPGLAGSSPVLAELGAAPGDQPVVAQAAEETREVPSLPAAESLAPAAIEEPAFAAEEQGPAAISETSAGMAVPEAVEATVSTYPTEAAPLSREGDTIATRFAATIAPIAAAVRASLETLARLIASTSAKAAPFASGLAERFSSASSAVSAKLHVLVPQLHGAVGKGAEKAGLYARAAVQRGGALLAKVRPAPSGYENEGSSPTGALSLPGRIGSYDLSQMLIISGVVLLVCGVLLLGGGLILRAGTGTVATGGGTGTTASVAKPESPHSVLWFFDEPDLPIVERSVFTAELTPQGVRLTGLTLKAENNSDVSLSGLEGVVKPDANRPDLKLEVKVDIVPAEGDGAQSAAAAEVQANGVVPPHAFFSLVFPFPPQAEGQEPGIALDDFIAAYGGLMLKLRYDVGGTEKSLIQYLSPEMLKAQLTEIQHEADKSDKS
jgi:hypothetical protein